MKKVIQTSIIIFMIMALFIQSSPICVLASAGENEHQKYQLSSNKREKVLIARELGIRPNQIHNIHKKSFTATTTNNLAHIEYVDDSGNVLTEPVDIEITEVQVSEKLSLSQQLSTTYYRPAKYTMLKASETKTTKKSKKGLKGSITWIDNLGPLNELTSVYGYADSSKSGYICKYSYGVGGLAGSIVTKTNSSFSVNKGNIGLKGLSFSFDFTTEKTKKFQSKTLIITTATSF